MSKAVEMQIIEAEEQLRVAMLTSNVGILSELLAPELIFTNHLGQPLGKKDDLEAYTSGLLKMEHLTPSERQILLRENVAIVSVRMRLAGTYEGNPASGDFRFTRVWAASPARNSWQIIAAHATRVA
jgi:hypothetical protein